MPSIFNSVVLLLGASILSTVLGAAVATPQQNLLNCLIARGIPADVPTSTDWKSTILPWNLALQYTPVAVTLPTTIKHVQDSIFCAASNGIKVQARSGGHSYASHSLGGKNGSLVIDLQKFQSISVDNKTFIASVGGGVRLGNMALAIYNQAQRALPHGTCPTVGIGGHATHGGYGYASRTWGFALDTIVALDVVLANGTFVHVTATSSPELFFGLRGAAESLGIVTTFYLQTLPAPTNLVTFSLYIPAALNSAQTAGQAMYNLQTFSQTSPLVDRRMAYGIYASSGGDFYLSGFYFGDKNYFQNTILKPMLNGFPIPARIEVLSRSWLDGLVWEAQGPLAQPLTGDHGHDTFYAKSVVTKESKPLTLAALTNYWDVFIKGRNAPDPYFTVINLYGGRDSVIAQKPAGFSAMGDRDALWVFQNYGHTRNAQPPLSPAITTYIDSLNDSLNKTQPTGDFGAYINYIDPNLTPAQTENLYFGQQLYQRLRTLKANVDPKNVFWNPQAVGTGP